MTRVQLYTVFAVLVAYVVLGHRYLSVWQSDRTLWPYAARLTPNNPVPVVNTYLVEHRP